MTDSVFRSASVGIPAPMSDGSDFKGNNVGGSEGYDGSEPIEILEDQGRDILLESLNIQDEINNMPEEDKEMHSEVKLYLKDIVKQKGLSPTISSFKRVLSDLKFEMGLDYEADPHVVLDRIGGVIKAWKQLTFIRNPHEKRALFMKLSRANSSSDMNRIVFEEMEKKAVWE